MKYEKEPFSSEQHIELLKSRGLSIPNVERAHKYLSNIGYYRLTGYMYHLQTNDGSHKFIKGIAFNDIILHYHFDKKLRFILLEYLERIEVALRAKLTDSFCVNHGFFWYRTYGLYDDKEIYASINQEIADKFEDPQERFLKYYKAKYTSESLPPSNMALEILSLGKLSRLYRGLANGDEKISIASDFGLPSSVLSTWFVYLNNIRNICAHHGRLWNRGLSADRPVIPSRKRYKFNSELPDNFNRSMYGVIAMVNRLLNNINPGNRFLEKSLDLFEEFPSVDVKLMGFPDNWKESPAWG
ncbi:Abortive infection bacteriophage resistance protein [Robiginitalea myxolifaciens]|uniref:Abortive infection bacteriophage resistance protein n=1 Tax=Robiginitalea myxolifaciens TaxID=400055 RepID=A0A1I6FSK9_9FLAO|nr:Abi family protein [Robiginitalea myxolifaciens]SFR32894.1 Abortive infection bacteriophage resistance protein [Robiginitalea myxolifaciens]